MDSGPVTHLRGCTGEECGFTTFWCNKLSLARLLQAVASPGVDGQWGFRAVDFVRNQGLLTHDNSLTNNTMPKEIR